MSKRVCTEDRADREDRVLGPEFDKLIAELRTKQGHEKNKYLNSNKSQILDAQQILDRKIVDVEYDIKRLQVVLRELTEKRGLFTYYDDYRDPY